MELGLKLKVYVETTVFSLIVARPSRHPLMAERQIQTRDWWNTDAAAFELYSSEVVRTEASRGDAEMARKRLELIDSIKVLAGSDSATALGQKLIDRGILPPNASTDALHLSIAALEKIDFLLTWNCAHLANGIVMMQVKKFWQPMGYTMPLIVTPEQLPGAKQR